MPTVALIADIHGNAWALERVLSELGRLDVDRIICLGDIAVLGPDPVSTTRRIREVAEIAVLGNVDAWLDPMTRPARAEPPATIPSRHLRDWARTRLSPDDLEWLTSLPMTATLEVAPGYLMRAFHGSPTSCDAVLSAGMTDDQVVEALGPGHPPVGILAGGHTHVPLLRAVGDGFLINPGSAGLPGVGPGTPGLHRNTDVHWADFAVLTTAHGQLPAIAFHRLELDVEAMLADARSSGMPEFAWWASLWRGDP